MESTHASFEQGLLNSRQNPLQDEASQLKHIRREIANQKDYCNAMLKDKAELEKAKFELEKMVEDYNSRIGRFQQGIEDEKFEKQMQHLKFQQQMDEAVKENDAIFKKQGDMKEELAKLEDEEAELEKQLKISSCMPRKQWIFTGNVLEDYKQEVKFDVQPFIRYPVRGGCALITFDDEAVAYKILKMEEHLVEIEECRINIKAHSLKLLMLEEIEIETRVCKNRILLSEIPKSFTNDQILDKLELHFSKLRNSGGEVEKIEMLQDSGNVVIKFIDEGVAQNLTKKEFHQVEFRGYEKNMPLRVSPFITGEIVKLKTCEIVSKRSVLFTGIPDVMDEEILQDILEIHFQKPSNGGGEVDAFVYIPEGKSAIVCFEADNAKADDKYEL
uniref:interferon-induced 35 kDa protein n=1 Tax=Pristiophorus japonicus TaxID=55135 RepID=UPI00398F3453